MNTYFERKTAVAGTLAYKGKRAHTIGQIIDIGDEKWEVTSINFSRYVPEVTLVNLLRKA